MSHIGLNQPELRIYRGEARRHPVHIVGERAQVPEPRKSTGL